MITPVLLVLMIGIVQCQDISALNDGVPAVGSVEYSKTQYYSFKLDEKEDISITVFSVDENAIAPHVFVSNVNKYPSPSAFFWASKNSTGNIINIPREDIHYRAPAVYYIAVVGVAKISNFYITANKINSYVDITSLSAYGTSLYDRYNYFKFEISHQWLNVEATCLEHGPAPDLYVNNKSDPKPSGLNFLYAGSMGKLYVRYCPSGWWYAAIMGPCTRFNIRQFP
jgi:hypothetical protein